LCTKSSFSALSPFVIRYLDYFATCNYALGHEAKAKERKQWAKSTAMHTKHQTTDIKGLLQFTHSQVPAAITAPFQA